MRRRNRRIGSINLFSVGILLLVVGFFLAYTGYQNSVIARNLPSWLRISGDLRGIRVGNQSGSSISYTYSWGGKTFEQSESAWGMDPARFAELSKQMNEADMVENLRRNPNYDGPPPTEVNIMVLANPQRPEQSTVQPEYYQTTDHAQRMWIGAGFIAGGLLFTVFPGILASLFFWRSDKTPWLGNTDWESFRVPVHGRTGLTWPFLGLLAASGLSLSLASRWQLSRPVSFEIVFAVAFSALVSFGFLIQFLSQVALRLKSGSSRVLLSQLPLEIGQPFSGAVLIDQDFPETMEFRLSLFCHQGPLGKEPEQIGLIGEESFKMAMNKGDPGSGLTLFPFKFRIPKDLPGRNPTANPPVFWLLRLNSLDPDQTFTGIYDLPVYQVDDPNLISLLGHKHSQA